MLLFRRKSAGHSLDVKDLKFTACQLIYTFIKQVFEGLATYNSKVKRLRPCLNVEIESVHRICLMTDSVEISYFGSKRP